MSLEVQFTEVDCIFSSSSLLLSSLELSDTQVYAPSIRARLGTAEHFCEVGRLNHRRTASTPPFLRILVFLVIYDSGYVSLEHLLLLWYPSHIIGFNVHPEEASV